MTYQRRQGSVQVERVARPVFCLAGLALMAGIVVMGVAVVAAQTRREFSVAARKYSYSVGGHGGDIKVAVGDLVRITLTADDIPHSFTIPEYRIDKRAEPGRPVTFEFRVDREGSVRFFCSLANDACKEKDMHGTLVVESKNPPLRIWR